MSKLERLIEKLCPNGVKFVPIGSVVDYEQPGKYLVSSDKYDDSATVPVLTAGKTFVLGYTTDTTGIYQANKDNPVIIFDDFTGATRLVDFPFKVKSSAIKMLKAKPGFASERFIYHMMKHIDFSSDEHKRLWISIYSSFSIPLPPLSVQEEIVRILDLFSELDAQLETELDARNTQYEYYRDRLLDFENPITTGKVGKLIKGLRQSGVKWCRFADVCTYTRGITYNKSKEARMEDADAWRVLRANNITLERNSLNFDDVKLVEKSVRVKANQLLQKGDILICAGSGSKEHIGKVAYVHNDIPYTFGGFMAVIRCGESVNRRFLFHILTGKLFSDYLDKTLQSTTINNLSSLIMNGFEFPVPPLPVQEEIVRILDKFEGLCNDLTQGLPAEIEARKKQYEYYRDKLLTFKELPQA